MIMEGTPIVVDLDGDGDAEIVTAAYENIIVVDGTGEELRRFDTRRPYSICPAIFEREGQSPLIYFGDNQGMFGTNERSSTVWNGAVTVGCVSPVVSSVLPVKLTVLESQMIPVLSPPTELDVSA